MLPPCSVTTGTPVKPWKSSPTFVSARTGVVVATAIVAFEGRDFTDADTVEKNCGSSQQACHGVLELNAIDGSLCQTTAVVQPVHKAEGRHDNGQYEQTDQSIGSAL